MRSSKYLYTPAERFVEALINMRCSEPPIILRCFEVGNYE